MLKLSEYNFEICHIPGRLNGQADALSRKPGYDQGENDNANVTVLLDHVFTQASTIELAPPLRQILSQEEMEPMNPVYEQNEDILKPWVDAH